MGLCTDGCSLRDRLYGWQREDGAIVEAAYGQPPAGWADFPRDGLYPYAEWIEARTSSGLMVSSHLVSCDGAAFTVYVDRPPTEEERAQARSDIRSDRDAVSIRFLRVEWAKPTAAK